MSVLRSLHVLAGCTALTLVVFAAALIANPALGQTLTNNSTIDATGAFDINGEGYDALQNNGTIITGGSPLRGHYLFINNAAGASIGTDTGISADTLGSFNNAGTLSASNSGALYVDTGDVDSITNSGTINGTMNAADNHTVYVRVGAVSSFENSARGVIGSSYNSGVRIGGVVGSFTNAGTISGATSGVFFEGSVTTFTNGGTISGGSTEGAYFNAGLASFVQSASGRITSTSHAGIYVAGATTSFSNAGTISGDFAGLRFGAAADTVSNSGSIIAANGDAILVAGGITSFTNSGILRGANAFRSTGAFDDNMTLLAGSEIYGVLDCGGGSDSLDFSAYRGTTVLQTSGLETITGGNLTYAATAGNATITIFDPTGTAAIGGSAVAGTVGAIQTAIANEFNNSSAGSLRDDDGPSGYVAQRPRTSAELAADQAVLSELDVATASNHKVWGTAFGGIIRDESPVALNTIYGGLVAGTHSQLDAQTRLGGLVGYSVSKFDVSNSQQVIDSQTGVVGVYGHTDLGALELTYTLLGGGSAHSSNRKVIAGGAQQTATAGFSSWFVNPSLGVAVPVLANDATEVKVAASGSYIYGGVGSYTETATGFTAVVGAMPISVFEARLELNGEHIAARTEHGDVRLRARIGVLAQANMGSSTIPLTLNGATTSFANPGTTTYGVYAGAGVSADVGAGLMLDGGADISARTDGTTAASLKASLVGSL